MAEYYRSFEVSSDGKHAKVGKVVEPSVLLLRERWIPLAEVLTATQESALYNRSADRPVFYAESWAWLHYLLLGAPARTPQLFKFLERLDAGTPLEPACREAFGTTVSALDEELRAYLRQLAFPFQVVTFTESIAGRTSAPGKPLSEAAVDARLGDLLMNMNRPDEAEARLQKALARDPGQVLALLSLGELRLRQQRGPEALEYLARATTLDPDSVAAQLAHGRALLRRAGRPLSPEVVETARKAYARALELRPDSIDAMAGLALSHVLAGARLDEARRLAERVIELDPREPDHQFLLAQVCVRQRDFAAARARLGSLMASPTPEVKERARALMAQLVDYEAATTRAPGADLAPGGAAAATGGSMRMPFLRQPKEGEQRAFGSLEQIECGARGAFLLVRSGDHVLRLSVPRMETMQFISYRADLKGSVGCGERKPPDPVYVTWRPAPGGPSATVDGEAVAVEFVPVDYVPEGDDPRTACET